MRASGAEAECFGPDSLVEFGAVVGFGVCVLDHRAHVDFTPGLLSGSGDAGVDGEGVSERGEGDAHQS